MEVVRSSVLSILEGNESKLYIPSYQKQYDWRTNNCSKFFDDLTRIINFSLENHFLGAFIVTTAPDNQFIRYEIVDGQQRLLTCSLILLALANLVKSEKLTSKNSYLADEIMDRYLVSRYDSSDNKYKLILTGEDQESYLKLFGDPENYNQSSKITINYEWICQSILESPYSADDIYSALKKLYSIFIKLDTSESAHEIFEGLNNSGLSLTEGDKVRNLLLMSLKKSERDASLEYFWSEIEDCCKGNTLTNFIQDYLSIKDNRVTDISNLYEAFKAYKYKSRLTNQELLGDLKSYAILFQKVNDLETGIDKDLDDALIRLHSLDCPATTPFIIGVLRLLELKKITLDDAKLAFSSIENYIFRRAICSMPSKSLFATFASLLREVYAIDKNYDNFIDKLNYILINKQNAAKVARMPEDEEFTKNLLETDIYNTNRYLLPYILDKIENNNKGTRRPIIEQIQDRTLNIDLIIPQTLTEEWKEYLGENAKDIYKKYVNKLVNITVVNYDSQMATASFDIKKTAENGFANSEFKMNKDLAKVDVWNEEAIQDRQKRLERVVAKAWPMLETNHLNLQEEKDPETSAINEGFDFTNIEILFYLFNGEQCRAATFTDMYVEVVKKLYEMDKSIITDIAYGKSENKFLKKRISTDSSQFRDPQMLSENIFIEKFCTNAVKTQILCELFEEYEIEPEELQVVYNLKESENSEDTEEKRIYCWNEITRKINEKLNKEIFGSYSEGNTDWIRIWVYKNTSIIAILPNRFAKADYGFSLSIKLYNAQKNKELFDYLYNKKEEIETKLNATLDWSDRYFFIKYTKKATNCYDQDSIEKISSDMASMLVDFSKTIIPLMKDMYAETKSEIVNL